MGSMIEQSETYIMFKKLYLLRERRLRNVQAFSSRCEAPCFDNSDKTAQLVVVHGVAPMWCY